MTVEEQIKEDLKLVKRIDDFGANLTKNEISFVDGWLRRLEVEKRPLSDAQRKLAERIDEERVE